MPRIASAASGPKAGYEGVVPGPSELTLALPQFLRAKNHALAQDPKRHLTVKEAITAPRRPVGTATSSPSPQRLTPLLQNSSPPSYALRCPSVSSKKRATAPANQESFLRSNGVTVNSILCPTNHQLRSNRGTAGLLSSRRTWPAAESHWESGFPAAYNGGMDEQYTASCQPEGPAQGNGACPPGEKLSLGYDPSRPNRGLLRSMQWAFNNCDKPDKLGNATEERLRKFYQANPEKFLAQFAKVREQYRRTQKVASKKAVKDQAETNSHDGGSDRVEQLCRRILAHAKEVALEPGSSEDAA
jgi:hypothetical protein